MSRSRFPFPTLIFMTFCDTQNGGDSRPEGGSGACVGKSWLLWRLSCRIYDFVGWSLPFGGKWGVSNRFQIFKAIASLPDHFNGSNMHSMKFLLLLLLTTKICSSTPLLLKFCVFSTRSLKVHVFSTQSSKFHVIPLPECKNAPQHVCYQQFNIFAAYYSEISFRFFPQSLNCTQSLATLFQRLCWSQP